MSSVLRFARAHAFWLLVSSIACVGLFEAVLQAREDAYIQETALRVVAEAHAETPRERVIALRDYVRRTVTFHGAPGGDGPRPFLRATAEETLRSGRGFCGEDSRAFVDLARSIGIEAQRVNLYGSMMHVVAEVELEPHQRLIVDAQNPPTIVDLEPIDEVILRPEFDDYYTLNLRRLRLGWLVSRVRLEMGVLTRWTENPHVLKATLWALMAGLLLAAKGARASLRMVLARRGWVHRSALAQAEVPPPSPVSVTTEPAQLDVRPGDA